MNRIHIFDSYTDVYFWNKFSEDRVQVNQGGQYSSKTVSIVQNITEDLLENSGAIGTITSQSWPNLSRGALRDFKNLVKTTPLLRKLLKNPNLVKGPFEFKNGSTLEFITTKDFQDAKSGKRAFLFINEANGIDYEVATELISRADLKVYLDFNANVEFWVHQELLKEPGVNYIISNYTHNPYLRESTISRILRYRDNYKRAMLLGEKAKINYWRNRWYVYGLGLTGVTEGVIFENVNYVKFFPFCDRTAYVIDWGFQDDPLALIRAGVIFNKSDDYLGSLYGKELIYETKLTTPKLIKRMRALGITEDDLIIADTSNWDGIGQLRDEGYTVYPAYKPPNSRKTGVKLLLDFEINLTHDSINWKSEQKNYKYTQENGKFTDEPMDGHDHCWDSLRMFGQTLLIKNRKKKQNKHKRRSDETTVD